MIILTTVLPFVGILLGLVILHELGHFFAAKLANVRIEEFGIGLPPRIRGKRFGETLYSINWLPIGGFVRLTGEESSGLLIEQVDPANPLLEGLEPGDRITHIDGKRVHTAQEFVQRVEAGVDRRSLSLLLTRIEPNGEERNFRWSISPKEEADRGGNAAAGRESEEPSAAPPRPGSLSTAPYRSADNPQHRPAEADRATAFGLTTAPDQRSLANQSRLTRIGILAAGAGVNAVLPIFLFAVAALIPDNVPAGPALVTSVIEGAPAQRAGIDPGDRIVAVNGEPILNAQELTRAIQMNLGETLAISVERERAVDSFSSETSLEQFELEVLARLAPQPLVHIVQRGESVDQIAVALGVPALHVIAAWGVETRELEPGLQLELPGGRSYITQNDDTIFSIAREEDVRIDALYRALGLDPRYPTPGARIEVPQGATGISVGNATTRTVSQSTSLLGAIPKGWSETVDTFQLVRNRIRSWIAGGEGLDLSGPVGIARITGEVVEQAGWVRLIELAALLSLNLAIINILPLPMLDGGRIFFVLVEIARRGRRISPEKEGLVHLAGFAALLIFIVVISYFDIVRAISGESLLR